MEKIHGKIITRLNQEKNCEMALNALSYYHMKNFLLCIKDEQEIMTFGDT